MKKCLITGGMGFCGKHLTKELEDAGYEVFVTDRDVEPPYQMDLLNYEQVRNVLYRERPDYIFHLAGISYVPSSWQDPNLVFEVNTLGSLNLFNAVRSVGIDPVIQIAGSSEEYGLVYPDEVPITEENELRPMSPYGVSKIAMDFLGYQYFKSYGMKIIRTRAFNHEGYGRPEAFMTSTFAKQTIEFKQGKIKTLKHGNLEAKRDITDVRDMARAYRLAVEKCEPGEVYNIGSGTVYTAKEILEKLGKLAGVKVKTEVDPARSRPSDVPILQCDSTKFRKQTNWKPKYKLENTLSEELRYWKERV